MSDIDCEGWLTFDLECNMLPEHKVRGSFYRRASRMLCVVTKEVTTGVVRVYEPGEEEEMMDTILTAPRLIAHNGRDFDIPALGNIFPNHNKALRSRPLIDTRWAALKSEGSPHGIYTYKQMSDFDLKKGFPKTKALNSVRSWGYRLGIPMIEEFKNADWENQPYTKELGDYCKVDVEITEALFKHLMDKRGYNIG